MIPISVNILKDTLDLKKNYDYIIKSLNKRVNNTITYDSSLILNNIIVSRDISYEYKGKKHVCRFSLSYYIHKLFMGRSFYNEAKRNGKINLYVGFYDQKEERKLCKKLIELDFKTK